MATQNYFKAKNGLEAPSQSTIAVTDSNFPTVRPTLNLDFAGSEVVDSRITFNRASAATYYGADGKLKYAAQNEPRIEYDPVTGECKGLLIEEQRTNLLSHSQSFDNSWWSTKSNANVLPNVAVAPDGSMTADKLIEDTANSSHSIFTVVPVSGSTTYTKSIYMKAAERTWGRLNMFDGTSGAGVNFNLANGTLGTVQPGVTATITPIGNGWYRCTMTSTMASGATGDRFQIATAQDDANVSYTGNGSSGIYIWGAQLEASSFATSYIPTTTSFTSRASSATYFDSTGTLRIAGTNQARYGYGYDATSGKWISQGLILEAAATNLITYSDQINTWINSGAITSTANVALAPDGTTSADSVYETSTNTTHNVASATFSYTSGTTYTSSVYAKYAGGSRAYFQIAGYNVIAVGTSASANFDLLAGTVTGQSNAVGTIQNVGNGWYRCSMTFTCTNSLTERTNFALINSGSAAPFTQYAGDASVGVYLWGGQTEVGNTATSYIPTLAASVTRAADVSSSSATTRSSDSAAMYGTNFSSWFNTSEGTVLMLTSLTNDLISRSDRFLTFASAGDESSKMQFDTETGGRLNFAAVANSQVQAYTYIENRPLVEYKLAAAYNTNDFAFTYNSTTPLTDTSGIVPNVTRLHIGSTSYSTETINGFVKKLVFYPKRLSNAQLQALTA